MDIIRFNYSNSFPERKSIRFQKENPFVSEAKSFVSRKKEEFVSKGPHAHVYSTETRNYPAYLAYPTTELFAGIVR